MFDKQKFKACIILAGKTMADVAKHLGINEATLYRKVNGTSDFYRNEMQQICDYLSIDNPTEIFFARKLTVTQVINSDEEAAAREAV